MTPTDEILREVEALRRVTDAGGVVVQIQAAPKDGKMCVTVRVKPARL